MRASRWVPAAAVVALVVGVLAARDGSAAEEADLRPPATGESPSPVPSLPEEDLPLVVEADGVPGARLGSAGEDLEPVGSLLSAGTGRAPSDRCTLAFPRTSWGDPGGQGELVWLVDGLVGAVVLSRWDAATAAPDPRLRTWLGPTLGSPLEEAEALPGARSSTERPFGAGGPTVRVVHVAGEDADGHPVETVFSDATYDPFSRDPDVRRVETLEVRRPEAAACSSEQGWDGDQVPGLGTETGDDLSIGLDGLDVAPFGTTTETLRTLPGLTPEGGGDGCEAWSASSGEGWARVVAVDGVVVEVRADGRVASRLPVQVGAGLDEVVAAYPSLAGRAFEPRGEEVEVPVDDRTVGLDLRPALGWVPDVEVPLYGGPLEVAGLAVRSAGTGPAGC